MSRCGRGRGLLRDQTPPASVASVGFSPSVTAESSYRPVKAPFHSEKQPRVIEARVTTILEPGNFWAQLGSAEDLAKFDGLIEELCAWCDEKGKGVDVYPKVGALIAVKESGAEKWTRAKVTRLVSSDQVREVEVFYVDTGTSGRINLKDVCSTLPPMLYGSPFQALQCSLQDVKVPHGTGESWSHDATARFAMLVSGPSARAKAIVHCITDNCFSVSLYTLFDGHWMSVGEILKKQGIALCSSSGPVTIDHLVDDKKREAVRSHSYDQEHLTTAEVQNASPLVAFAPENTLLDTALPDELFMNKDGTTMALLPGSTPYTPLESPPNETNKVYSDAEFDNSPPPLTQPKKGLARHGTTDHDDMPPLSVVPPLKQLLEQQFAGGDVSGVLMEEDEAVKDVKYGEVKDGESKVTSEDRSGSVTPLADTIPEPTKQSGEAEKQGENYEPGLSEADQSGSTTDQTDVSVDVKGQRKCLTVAVPVHSGGSSDDVFQVEESDGDSLSSSEEWDESLLPPSTHSESSETTPQLFPAKTDVSRHATASTRRKYLQETLEIADMIYSANQHKYPKRPPRKQNEGSYRRNIPGNRRGNIDQSAPYHSRSQEPFRDSPGKGSRYQDREDSFLDREPHFQDREASFQDSGPRYQDREGSFQDRGPGNTGMGRGNWLSNNREKSSNVGKMKGVKFMQQPVRPPGGRGVPRHKTTQHQPPQQFQHEQDVGISTSKCVLQPPGHGVPTKPHGTVITGLSKDEVVNEANWHIFNIEKDLKQDFMKLSADNVQAFGFRVDSILQGKNALSLLALPTADDPLEVIFSYVLEETVNSKLDSTNLDLVTAALSSIVKTVVGDRVFQLLQLVLDKKAQEVSELQDSRATDAGRRRHMFCSLLGKLFIAASFSECAEYHSSVGYSVQKCLETWTKFAPGQSESHRYAYTDCLRALCEEIGPTMDVTKMESLDAYFDGPIMELMLSELQPRAVREILIKLSLKRARKWDGKRVVCPPSAMAAVHQHQVQSHTNIGMSRFSQEAPSPAANVVHPIPLSVLPEPQQLAHTQEPAAMMSPTRTAFLPMRQTLRSQSMGTLEQAPSTVMHLKLSRSQSDSGTESPYIQIHKMLEELQLLVLFPEFKKGMLTDHLLDCDDVNTLKGCLQDSGIPAGAVYRIIEYTIKRKHKKMSQSSADSDFSSSPANPFQLSAPSTSVVEQMTPYQIQVGGPVQPHQTQYSPGTRQLSTRPHSVQTPGRYVAIEQQPPKFASQIVSPYQSKPLSPVGSRSMSVLPLAHQVNRHAVTPYPSGSITPAGGSVMFPRAVLPTSQRYTPQQQEIVTPSSYQDVVASDAGSEALSQSHASYLTQVSDNSSGYHQTAEYGVASYSSPSTAQRKLAVLSSNVNSPRETGSTLPRETGITVRLPHSPKQPQTGQTQEKQLSTDQPPKRGGFGTVNCLLCGSISHTTPSCSERGNFFFH